MLLQVRVHLLLNFCNLIYVFYTNTASHVLPRLVAALHLAGSLLDEPGGGRGLDHELKATIDVGLEDDAHGDLAIVLACAVVEFFTKLHHVDAEGTEGLTDLGRRLGDSRVDIETH